MKARIAILLIALIATACQLQPRNTGIIAAPPATPRSSANNAPSAIPTSYPTITSVPAPRLARLAKAVNITRWFWYREGDRQDYAQTYITDHDLKLIRDLGVLSVRLVISPTLFFQVDKPAELNPDTILQLDYAVDQLLAHDLAVVFDMHDEDKDALERDPNYVDNFLIFWPTLAKRYADRDIDRVFFEIVNEPRFENRPNDWRKIQQRWIDAMRVVVPNHTLIVTGSNWGGLTSLEQFEPYEDRNLVYSFHFYDPMEFTHQSATWAEPVLGTLHNLPYPSSPKACEAALKTITDSFGQDRARWYCMGYWTGSKLKTRIADADQWSREHHRPVWMGEFGVFCQSAPVDSRAKWIADVRKAAESFKIGWAVWGYDECFGLQRKPQSDGSIKLDMSVVQALGLTPPK